MDPIVRIDELTKKYPDFTMEISSEIHRGYITGLIGANGAGKTTFINILMNITKPDEGRIYYDNEVVNLQTYDYKEDIGIVFDSICFPSFWTAETIAIIYRESYTNWSDEKFIRFLNRFHIDFDKTVSTLSKGMQMKLMVAAAISHNPNLLILDEPTSGLDPVSRDDLLAVLQDYMEEENHTVLFSTHNTSDLEKVADFIIYLNDGSIEYSGEKYKFVDSFRLVQGPKSQFGDYLQDLAVGCEVNSYSFKILIKTADLEKINANNYQITIPNIEDIMIFTNKSLIKEVINESM